MSSRIDRVFKEQVRDSYELIFVNDGSPNPETWPELEKICELNPNVRAIQLSRNFGQSAATLCGFKEAKGKYVVTMDDDLQHRPEDIPALLAERHHDIVIGRLKQKKHNLFKRLSSRVKGDFDRIILGKPRHIQMSSFRCLCRVVVDGILSIYTPYPFIPALMFYVSQDVVNVVVEHQSREEGKTGYSLIKMIRLFSNLIINNSSLLLRFMGYIGVTISAFSLLLAAYFIWKKWALGISVLGWTSVIVSVLFIGGLILFSIGVVGEYLIRIIQGVERKPTYVIRQQRGKSEDDAANL
jgi:dolichol-phosphate mannosyltransferase/undecaprenyl-phosphate 4-deoxy-4-formamido-L-arabinose transferase